MIVLSCKNSLLFFVSVCVAVDDTELRHIAPSVVKECHSAVAACVLEAVKHNVDRAALRYILYIYMSLEMCLALTSVRQICSLCLLSPTTVPSWRTASSIKKGQKSFGLNIRFRS